MKDKLDFEEPVEERPALAEASAADVASSEPHAPVELRPVDAPLTTDRADGPEATEEIAEPGFVYELPLATPEEADMGPRLPEPRRLAEADAVPETEPVFAPEPVVLDDVGHDDDAVADVPFAAEVPTAADLDRMASKEVPAFEDAVAEAEPIDQTHPPAEADVPAQSVLEPDAFVAEQGVESVDETAALDAGAPALPDLDQWHPEPPLHARIPEVLPSEERTPRSRPLIDLVREAKAEYPPTVRIEPVFEPRPVPLEEEPPTEFRDPPVDTVSITPAVVIPTPRRAEPEMRTRKPARSIGSYVRQAVRLGAFVVVGFMILVLALIGLYRWVNPPVSTLMLGQWLTGTKATQRWVPIDSMSTYLHRAVITSEDGQFCRHRGVDWAEIEEAIERARDGIPRGGSTISMQVVKNLFLWPSKSYVRKALEIPLTYAIEFAWSKRRILEIYLNIAEWGPGIFGAEAAARYHFGRSAAQLTPGQSALLAASLPNPIERRAGSPGPGTARLASTVQARMLANPGNAACIRPRG